MRLPRMLEPVEIRVLGCLLEKQQATPEYYPLTLNALLAACNQKSNREPVVDLAESSVLAALEALRELVLVWKVTGSRAEKWEENLTAKLGLEVPDKAILTLLFLRGPQTPGEIRSRGDRLHAFPSLDAVEAALAALASGPDPLVAALPRRAGQKETRWAHLLSGEPQEGVDAAAETFPPGSLADRVARLEADLATLRAELNDLRKSLGEPGR